MKTFLSILFVIVFTTLQSQEIADKEAFKKCRKEFNKKTCLADADKDGVPNYLDECREIPGAVENHGCPWPDSDKDGILDKDDQCPEVFGVLENNGCPWPDTDGDGILDKDDKCPTIAGIIKHDGCPPPYVQDCKALDQQDSLNLVKLKIDEKKYQSSYNQLNKKLISYLPKEYLGSASSFTLYLNYIDFPICCYADYCCRRWDFSQHNYLINQFWNEQTIKTLLSRKDVSAIFFNTRLYESIFPDLYFLAGKSQTDFFNKNYNPQVNKIVFQKNKAGGSDIFLIEVNFRNDYDLDIMLTYKSWRKSLRMIYKDGKWIEMKN